MATTYNNATGDGNEKNFTYTFPTIEETNTTANTNSEVKVALDGITQAANRYTVHTNPAKIQFNNTNGVDSTVQEADGAPKSAVKVRVYRDTDVDSASVDRSSRLMYSLSSPLLKSMMDVPCCMPIEPSS